MTLTLRARHFLTSGSRCSAPAAPTWLCAQSYRDDLQPVKKITGFRYVRFHAIFHDENGVYSEDAQGNPVYNWSYVDQIYDGLLANGVRPFVEISFMPKALAARIGLSRVLVQADRLAAQGLREVGRADHGLRAAS